MSNYIVIGDIHLGAKNSSHIYHDVAKRLFDKVFEYASKHNIKYLIQVGDMYDNRKALTHDTIDTSLSIAEKVNEVFEKSYFIVGNHDTARKDDLHPHALIILKKFENIVVVDKPTLINKILMLPWMFDIEDMVSADICIGHFDINGVMMNTSGTLSRNHRLNLSDFSKYRMTISGHYHTPAVYDHNVRYIGSPYQLTFNDIGSERGFYHLNTDIPALDRIKFVDYPHHYSFTDKSSIIDDLKGHIVRLTFTENHGIDGNKEIIDRFRNLEPLSLIVKYANSDSGMTDESVSEEVMMKESIDILFDFYEKSGLPEGINIDVLKKVSMSIYKEIGNV